MPDPDSSAQPDILISIPATPIAALALIPTPRFTIILHAAYTALQHAGTTQADRLALSDVRNLLGLIAQLQKVD